MARLPRLTLPGHVHHVLQRGNNGQAIFLEMADYQRMLALLAEYAPTLDVAVHAYLLMPGSLHLLATPGTADGLPALMQAVGRRYVRYFNDTHGRTGTLWDGRFRSTPVQAERYLLPSMVWLDTAPVAAGLVTEPTLYPWSSCGFYSGVRSDRLPKPHALFWRWATPLLHARPRMPIWCMPVCLRRTARRWPTRFPVVGRWETLNFWQICKKQRPAAWVNCGPGGRKASQILNKMGL